MATPSTRPSTSDTPFSVALEILTVATGIMGVVSVGIGAMASATGQEQKITTKSS